MTSTEDLLAIIASLPEQLSPDPTRDKIITNASKLSMRSAEVLIGTFTGTSTIAVVLRVYLHLRSRGRLFLDDWLVVFANLCLLVETGVLYYMLDMVFAETVISHNPAYITLFSRGQVLQMLNGMLKWSNIYVSFAWTSNYAIKLSFLALFNVLISNVSQELRFYWWFALCFTIASWVFNMVENFIICGAGKSMKCFPYPKYNIEMGASSTAADVLTDLMIISTPILLLRKTRLPTSDKLRILAFLCLSTTMLGFAFARFAGGLGRDYQGVLVYFLTWTNTWLHIESSVAVLMGGLTAFRTVFARHAQEKETPREKKSGSTLGRYVLRLLGKDRGTLSSRKVSDAPKRESRLGDLRTGATLKGLRTFIRRHERAPGETTMRASAADSIGDSNYDPLESYHNFKKKEDQKSGSMMVFTADTVSNNKQQFELPELHTHNMV